MDTIPDATTLIKFNQRFGEKRVADLNKQLVGHWLSTERSSRVGSRGSGANCSKTRWPSSITQCFHPLAFEAKPAELIRVAKTLEFEGIIADAKDPLLRVRPAERGLGSNIRSTAHVADIRSRYSCSRSEPKFGVRACVEDRDFHDRATCCGSATIPTPNPLPIG